MWQHVSRRKTFPIGLPKIKIYDIVTTSKNLLELRESEMVKIGYARVSTTDQNLEAQEEQLRAAGCTKLFVEKVSGAKQDRPELNKMLEFVREGDMVVTTKLDRLGRSVKHLHEVTDLLKERGVALNVLNLGMDTSTPTGQFMFSVLAAVAEFERNMLLERQKEGIEHAKLKGGIYKGRKPTARAKNAEVIKLLSGGISKAEIARKLEIGLSSVYRAIKDHQEETNSDLPSITAQVQPENIGVDTQSHKSLKRTGTTGYNGALRAMETDMSTTAADRARALVNNADGDFELARNRLLENLRKEYPGFSAGGKGSKKGQQHYQAQREYDAVRKHINEMERKASAESITNQVITSE